VGQLAPQLRELARPLLATAVAVGLSMLEFVLAVVLAGVFLAFFEDGYRLTRTIGKRLAGQRGVALVDLSEPTIRSVARGVLGVAVIQAFMAGAGLVVIGVSFAGVWTVVALLLGVLQVGVGLIMIPAAIVCVLHARFAAGDTLPGLDDHRHFYLIFQLYSRISGRHSLW
jgi:predicted PurR-regulated permease PerM